MLETRSGILNAVWRDRHPVRDRDRVEGIKNIAFGMAQLFKAEILFHLPQGSAKLGKTGQSAHVIGPKAEGLPGG